MIPGMHLWKKLAGIAWDPESMLGEVSVVSARLFFELKKKKKHESFGHLTETFPRRVWLPLACTFYIGYT